MNFSQLGLQSSLVRRCDSLKYKEPTPIQRLAIPVILDNIDLIGCAETGTGKTAAFMLPLIQKISLTKSAGIRSLILAPTRELAAQIATNFHELNVNKNLRAVTIVGGASMRQQHYEIKRGAQIIIATPGRLLDHIERGSLKLSSVEMFVLDEADRMLDMGFLPAIRKVLTTLPSKRQTLLFSATMSPQIETLARSMMNSPKVVEVNPRGRAAETVEQYAYTVATESKTALLLDLLEKEPSERVLVFTRTKRGAERLSHILQAREHKANRIHADRTQSQRESALRGFREGSTRVLVATDIAARGIDVDSVSHVINYDIPTAPEDYVHRIGRTGRAGKKGRAITLVTPVDELSMRAIERLTGQKIERVTLTSFGGVAPNSPNMVNSHGFGASNGSGNSGNGWRSFRPRRAGR